MEAAAVSWRRLHNEELHNFYASTNIIRVIKSRRKRWTGLKALMGKTRNAYKILVGNPEGKMLLQTTSTDRKIISDWILGK
jgi:hypothetical protein